MTRLEVRFFEGSIHFPDYRYAPASVVTTGAVRAVDIRDADPRAAPPEVRLHTGETLFVSGAQQTELRTFCAEHGIPLRSRPDVWDALLQPFVDTEFTDGDDVRTAELLARFGIDVDEAAGIRARFGPAMVAYNLGTGLWDWVHLGLMDLLEALSGECAGEHRLPPDAFAETYRWAMALADRSAGAAEPVTDD